MNWKYPRQDRAEADFWASSDRRFASLPFFEQIDAKVAEHDARHAHRERQRQFKRTRAKRLMHKLVRRRYGARWAFMLGGKSYERSSSRHDGRVVFDFGHVFGLLTPDGRGT